jgi:acylphosphatase
VSVIFIRVHGQVQGVGYRYFVAKTAKRLGVTGWVKNNDDGSVEIVADSDDTTLEKFVKGINIDYSNGPSVMKIDILGKEQVPTKGGFPGFTVR